MKGVVDFGTAARLRYRYKFTAEIAGKTGTTNNNSDGWFIGITPKLVSGGWVGGENRAIHFDNTSMGSGTSMALPIWAEYMKRVYADSSLMISQDDIFIKPAGVEIDLDCEAQSSSRGEKSLDDYDDSGSVFDN